MGDHEHCGVRKGRDAVLDHQRGIGIHVGQGLVQDDDGGPAQ